MEREDIKFDLSKNRLPKIGRRYGIRVILYGIILVLLGLWYWKKSSKEGEKALQSPSEIKVEVELNDSLSR